MNTIVFNDEQLKNKKFKLITLLIFHLEILGNDNKDKQLANITSMSKKGKLLKNKILDTNDKKNNFSINKSCFLIIFRKE